MHEPSHNIDWLVKARYGLFVHYGLYSQLGRGEWAMNRERMSRAEMNAVAEQFAPDRFDADTLCDLAVECGMRYVNLTTMHHDGFRLYDTGLSDFNAKRYTGRDLVAELVTAARKRALRIALYHSLNNWYDQPDAADALESKDAYAEFIENTFARIRELVTRFNPVDVLWYDGWWPFNAHGWRAQDMNRMVRSIQPNILLNGRNGLAGDFTTPEQHMTAPIPWWPWEGCMTLNDHWGYHSGDHEWKSAKQVTGFLAKAAAGKGNLLINIGPRGDGSIPEPSVQVLKQVGAWLKRRGECIFDTDRFTFGLMSRESHEADWSHQGPFTRRAHSLYHLVRYWPGSSITIAGLDTEVESVSLLGASSIGACELEQHGDKVTICGLPETPPDPLCPVLRLDCRQVPSLYLTAGMRIPGVPHPPYDPMDSDIGG